MAEQEKQAPSAPEGWYPNPEVHGSQRYWDGEQWTEHVHPPAPAPAPVQKTTGGLFGWGVVTALLLPLVGFIIGIVLLSRDDNRGLLVMLGSVGACIFWYNQLQPDPAMTYYGY